MTADEPRVRVTTNMALGICLILLGTTLILDRLQIVPAMQLLRFWPIALILFGAAFVIQSFQPPATQADARRQETGLGPVIVLAIVAVFIWNGSFRSETTRTDASERADVVALMSRHQQVSSAAVFRGGEMTTIMGRAEVDLRKTTVASGEEVVIHVFTVMGGSTIRVPEGWNIDLRTTSVMGGARDRRHDKGDVPGAPRIVVRGFIMWGALNVRS